MRIITLLFLVLPIFITQTQADVALPSQTPIIGCWSGMNGGKLKITTNKIYDLGSKENSSYKEKSITKREIKGLQTGEEYLLETTNNFPKSFLSKWVRFSFNSDGTVSITTYDSHNDYLKDNFVGMGLFQKISCKNLKRLKNLDCLKNDSF
jgi:hypothetical protein